MPLPLVSIALGLAARFLPDLVSQLGGKKAGQVTEQIINVAEQVTGISEPEQAAEAIHADPELQLKFMAESNRSREAWKKIELQEWEEENRQVRAMEGTAADVKGIPLIGPVVIILRSLQRPLWGYATLFMAWKVFSGGWTLDAELTQQAFYFNLGMVVLTIFGERALKNLLPVLAYFFPRLSVGKKD